MITNPRIENNELLFDGLPQIDENYNGFCCPGYDYIICIVNPEYPLESVWGACQNPNCPVGGTFYHGISHDLIENFALKLAEANVP